MEKHIIINNLKKFLASNEIENEETSKWAMGVLTKIEDIEVRDLNKSILVVLRTNNLSPFNLLEINKEKEGDVLDRYSIQAYIPNDTPTNITSRINNAYKALIMHLNGLSDDTKLNNPTYIANAYKQLLYNSLLNNNTDTNKENKADLAYSKFKTVYATGNQFTDALRLLWNSKSDMIRKYNANYVALNSPNGIRVKSYVKENHLENFGDVLIGGYERGVNPHTMMDRLMDLNVHPAVFREISTALLDIRNLKLQIEIPLEGKALTKSSEKTVKIDLDFSKDKFGMYAYDKYEKIDKEIKQLDVHKNLLMYLQAYADGSRLQSYIVNLISIAQEREEYYKDFNIRLERYIIQLINANIDKFALGFIKKSNKTIQRKYFEVMERCNEPEQEEAVNKTFVWKIFKRKIGQIVFNIANSPSTIRKIDNDIQMGHASTFFTKMEDFTGPTGEEEHKDPAFNDNIINDFLSVLDNKMTLDAYGDKHYNGLK